MSKTKLLRLLGCLLFVPGVIGAQIHTSSGIDPKAQAAEMTGTIKDYSAGNTLVVETTNFKERPTFDASSVIHDKKPQLIIAQPNDHALRIKQLAAARKLGEALAAARVSTG